ncbi:PREDICTED: beta carbonic anhydrase 3-like [Camelina sativa]|uniref:Beta carbonic anhydrase 3-like n=1 Tax=Camelina sativa TaxID=90675 RepID=A0ABM1R8X0_CAMSA|nr:PREDICTED: beta carbonic anhydrase 3-like [Camelina sativa]
MSTESYEDAIKRLDELLSKNADLGNVAAAKIKKLTDELEELDSNKLDAVERTKSGFIHFKTNHFEKNPTLYNALAKSQSPKVLDFTNHFISFLSFYFSRLTFL